MTDLATHAALMFIAFRLHNLQATIDTLTKEDHRDRLAALHAMANQSACSLQCSRINRVAGLLARTLRDYDHLTTNSLRLRLHAATCITHALARRIS